MWYVLLANLIFVKVFNLYLFIIMLGNFVNCILEANHSAQKLLEIISENFFHFRDESIYNNQTGYIIYYYLSIFILIHYVQIMIIFF